MAHKDFKWMEEAQCLEMGNDLHFSRDPHEKAAAKLICSMCPVQKQCLDYAMRTPVMRGIWGGLDDDERYELRIESQWNGQPRTWAFGSRGGQGGK